MRKRGNCVVVSSRFKLLLPRTVAKDQSEVHPVGSCSVVGVREEFLQYKQLDRAHLVGQEF